MYHKWVTLFWHTFKQEAWPLLASVRHRPVLPQEYTHPWCWTQYLQSSWGYCGLPKRRFSSSTFIITWELLKSTDVWPYYRPVESELLGMGHKYLYFSRDFQVFHYVGNCRPLGPKLKNNNCNVLRDQWNNGQGLWSVLESGTRRAILEAQLSCLCQRLANS